MLFCIIIRKAIQHQQPNANLIALRFHHQKCNIKENTYDLQQKPRQEDISAFCLFILLSLLLCPSVRKTETSPLLWQHRSDLNQGRGWGQDFCCGFNSSHLGCVSPIFLRTGAVLRWNKYIWSRKLSAQQTETQTDSKQTSREPGRQTERQTDREADDVLNPY